MSASRRGRVTNGRSDAHTRRPSRRRCACPRPRSLWSGRPSTPTGLTAATPPLRIVGSNSGNGARFPASHRSVSTSDGEICSNSDVSVWPAWASPPAVAQGHHPMSRPSARRVLTARCNAPMLPPWPLTKTRRCAQQAADLPYSTSSSSRRRCRWRSFRGNSGARRWRRRRWPAPPTTPARGVHPAPRATAAAILVSVSNGRCGPCCSVDPSGTMIDGEVLNSSLDVAAPNSPSTGTR